MYKMPRLIKDYWLIVFALYCTGSIYFVSFNYSTVIPLLFFACVAALMLSKEKNAVFTGNQVMTVIIFLLFMSFVWALNGVTKYTPYFAIIFQLLAGLLITIVIPMREFINRYINVMCFFAAVSLACFAIFLVYPQFALNFKRTTGDVSVYYYNAYIHVFESSKGYSGFVPFNRNAGIFWEPGAYQAFLNMALWFMFLEKNQEKSKYYTVKIAILVLTVITTYSTTGYIVMAIILLANFTNLMNKMAAKGIFSLAVVMALIIAFGFINSKGSGMGFMSYKLTTEFGEEKTFLNRLFLDDLGIIIESPLNLFGISYEQYEKRGLFSGNSIVQTMVTLGVPFTVMLLRMYWRFSVKYKKPFLLFVTLIMMLSTESLIWRPIFLCFAWYGLSSEENQGNLYEYNSFV